MHADSLTPLPNLCSLLVYEYMMMHLDRCSRSRRAQNAHSFRTSHINNACTRNHAVRPSRRAAKRCPPPCLSQVGRLRLSLACKARR